MTTTVISPVLAAVLAPPIAPVARHAVLRAGIERMREARSIVDGATSGTTAHTAARAELQALRDGLRAMLRNRPAYTIRWTGACGPHSYTTTRLGEIEVRGRMVARMAKEGRADDIEIVVAATGEDVTFDFACFRE